MLHRSVCVILITSIFVHALGMTLTYGLFLSQRNVITNKYCVNKNNTSLHCHGSCYLKKELNHEEQREKQGLGNVKDKSDHYFKQPNDLSPSIFAMSVINFIDYNIDFSLAFTRDIFQPPKFSLRLNLC